MNKIHRIIDRFEAKQRGTAQAHIAAQLTQELRNELEAIAQPAQEAEPVAWYTKEHSDILDLEWSSLMPKYEGEWKPLYTTPQQSQPLTDEQKNAMWVCAKRGLSGGLPEDYYIQGVNDAEHEHGIKGGSA